MARLSALLLPLLATAALGHRLVDVLHVELEEEARLQPELTTRAPEGLRIFAATINGGNQAYSDSNRQFDDMVDKLTDGHEVPGEEADIALIGFQEFTDGNYAMGKRMQQLKLWRRQSEEAMSALRRRVAELLRPGAEAAAAKEALQRELGGFGDGMKAKLAEFKKAFGKDATDFHAQLADQSAVLSLVAEARALLGSTQAKFREELQKQAREKQAAAGLRFEQLDAAADALSAAVGALPDPSKISSYVRPIREWSKAAWEKMSEARSEFPNLKYSDGGVRAWNAVEEHLSVDATEKAIKAINEQSQDMHAKFKTSMEAAKAKVKQDVQAAEDEAHAKLLSAWQKIDDDVKVLIQDLASAVRTKIASGASGAVEAAAGASQAALERWAGKAGAGAGRLLGAPELPLAAGHVEVQMEPQRWESADSGGLCGFASYSTQLYVYVNPWSQWKIEAVPYSSHVCKKRDGGAMANKGCSINNGAKGECGKVVNLQVFRAARGSAAHRLCLMNTHMSKKGDAGRRMMVIGRAMSEAREAKCNIVVFVGDFNSRLHCDLKSRNAAKPVYDTEAFGSSFNNVMNLFCSGDACSLSNHTYVDELRQMLERDVVECWQKETRGSLPFKKEEYWSLTESPNSAKQWKLREPTVPSFPPTYKLGSFKSTEAVDAKWKRCLPNEPSCFVNDDHDPEHNPAWTDRILVQAPDFTTKMYARRPLEIKTDHAAVVTQVTIGPGAEK